MQLRLSPLYPALFKPDLNNVRRVIVVARLERKNRAKEEKIEKKNRRVREVRKENGVDRLLVARLFLFEGGRVKRVGYIKRESLQR